jgi:tetratricopeptide (TPR) repeat protein
MINFVSGNYGKASIYNERALRAAESRQDWMLIGIHLNNGSRIAHRLGEYDTALANLQQSLEMRSRVGDRTGMGFTLYSIGLVYTYQGIYDKAEEAFRESMKIREAINDERGLSYCLHGLGLVYLGRGELEQAETYFLPAKEMEERLNLKGELIGTISYLGQLYLRMERSTDALSFSQQAIDMLAEQKNVEEVQQIYLNHYRVLAASGDAAAEEYLQKAQEAVIQQANAIDDLEKRETFLQKVKVNQEIAAALTQHQ